MTFVKAFLRILYYYSMLSLPYYYIGRVDGQSIEKTKLKNELLANLNRYSEKGSDLLEPLGTPQGPDPPPPKELLGTPPVPPPPPSSSSRNINTNNNNNGLLNLFNPQPSSIFGAIPNIFNGLLPLTFTTPPPFRPIGMQPFGSPTRNPQFPPTPTPTPPFLTLPTLLPFFAQNGVPQELPRSPLIDNEATLQPRFINHTIPPMPPPTVKSMSEAVSENIRDWRQRFYKAFKKLSGRGPFPSTPVPPPLMPSLQIHSLPPPIAVLPRPTHHHQNEMQPVIVFNESTQFHQPQHRRNYINNNPNQWLSNEKVKTYARDSKGRIVRLFGVESSGYRYNNSNTNGFIPIPDPPGLSSQNVDIGPVYIPAARPSTSSEMYNSYPSTPPPPINTYIAPMPYPSPQPTSSSIYTVQMPAPPSVAPYNAYPAASTFEPISQPSDQVMTQEVDGLDYDAASNQNNNDSPCIGCDQNQNPNPQQQGSPDPWLLGENGIMENNEKCNSLRLRYIIQESIVGADAEASKRAIQLRAENELNTFYNVVCGTGFFSYIAHTDEFCQASASGINCYVFSPVCSLRMQGMGAGIARKRKKLLLRKRKSFVNKN